jgi:hypothetical protein
MMDGFAPFASPLYAGFLIVLLFSRGADFLSTWIATPGMVLEGNPIARKLGWRWGTVVNLGICVVLAAWPFAAITVATTSLLVAARNLQSAWLMRTLGEEAYRDWYVRQIRRTPWPLYLLCLFGQVALIAAVGSALILFPSDSTVALPVGVGIIAYAMAILVYTLLAYWRIRRTSSFFG